MNNTKKTSPKKRGRPPLAKGQVKAKIVPMRLDDADVKVFEKASTKQSLSEWMRSTLREVGGMKSTILEAAKAALKEVGLAGVVVDDAVQHTASHDFNLHKWSVHFRKRSDYFRVVLDTHYVHVTYGPRNLETLTAEMTRLLENPKNHIPLS